MYPELNALLASIQRPSREVRFRFSRGRKTAEGGLESRNAARAAGALITTIGACRPGCLSVAESGLRPQLASIALYQQTPPAQACGLYGLSCASSARVNRPDKPSARLQRACTLSLCSFVPSRLQGLSEPHSGLYKPLQRRGGLLPEKLLDFQESDSKYQYN